MSRGLGSIKPEPTDLYTHGLREWFTTILKAIPAKISTLQHNLRETIPDLPQLTAHAVAGLDHSHANIGFQYNNSGKIDFIGNISTKGLVEVPKVVYELIRPRKLNIQFEDINAVLLDAFVALVPEIKLMATTTSTSTPSQFPIPIIFCPTPPQGGKKSTGKEAMSTPVELIEAVNNPSPLIFLVRRAATKHVNFNLVINPYLSAFPDNLVDIVVAMFWDIVILGKVVSSQLKATKKNLLRFAIAQGILLYPSPESQVMKFPEESKLFSILLEKLNQAHFTDAIAASNSDLLFPHGAPQITLSFGEGIAESLTAVSPAAVLDTVMTDGNMGTKAPLDDHDDHDASKINNNNNNDNPPPITPSSTTTTTSTATTASHNPIRSLPIPTTLNSQLIIPNDISHKKVNQTNPQEQQDNLLNNYPLFTMAPLGHVTSCYTSKYGIPRQPMLVPHSRAMINIRRDIPSSPNTTHNALLDGLDQYSHLFVHFIFNDNYTQLLKEYNHDTSLLQANASLANPNQPQSTVMPQPGTVPPTLNQSPACSNEPLIPPFFLPQPIREPQSAPKESNVKIDTNLQPIPYVHNSGLGRKKGPAPPTSKDDGNTIVQLGVTPGTTTTIPPASSSTTGVAFAPKLPLTRSIFVSAPRNETRPPKLQTSYNNSSKDGDNKTNHNNNNNCNTKNAQVCGFSATRAPHRFNPIGQSLVKIESIDAGRGIIYISGHDLMNNTLILDIKPLHLSDIPMYQTLCLPAWVHNAYTKQFSQLLKTQGVIGSPYGFTTDHLVLNGKGADVLKMITNRVEALAQTKNTVKPLVFAPTALLNEGTPSQTNVSPQELLSLQKTIPQDQFNSIVSQSPLLASFLQQSNAMPAPTTTTSTTTTSTTMSDDDTTATTTTPPHSLVPDGFPALALCNETACIQFDPLVLLYLQYCFWCQYNLNYSREQFSTKALDWVTKLQEQYLANDRYDEEMKQYHITLNHHDQLSMIPPNLPIDQPLPTFIPPRPTLPSSSTLMGDGDNEDEGIFSPPPTSTTTIEQPLNTTPFPLDTTTPPSPQPPAVPAPFIPSPSLFSSLIALVPIPDSKYGKGMKDCPHLKDFHIAFTGETSSTHIRDPTTMYTGIIQLYANHFKTNPFNTQSSYNNITVHGNQTQQQQQEQTATTSTPQSIDDYLQSEYQSFLHTIIQTLSCDPRSHHAISKSQSIFSFQLDNFNISFQINAETAINVANTTYHEIQCGCNSIWHNDALEFVDFNDLYTNLGEYQTEAVSLLDSQLLAPQHQDSIPSTTTITPQPFEPYQQCLNPFTKAKCVATEQYATRLNIRIFHIQYVPSNPNITNHYSIPSRNRWLPTLYGFEWFLQKLLFSTQFMPSTPSLALQTTISYVQYQLFHARAWYQTALFYTQDQPSPRSAAWLKDLVQYYPQLVSSQKHDDAGDDE